MASMSHRKITFSHDGKSGGSAAKAQENGEISALQNDVSDDYCLELPQKKQTHNELAFFDSSQLSSPQANPNRIIIPGSDFQTSNHHDQSLEKDIQALNNNPQKEQTTMNPYSNNQQAYQKEPESEPRLANHSGNATHKQSESTFGRVKISHPKQDRTSLVSVAHFEGIGSGVQSSDFFSRHGSNIGSETEILNRIGDFSIQNKSPPGADFIISNSNIKQLPSKNFLEVQANRVPGEKRGSNHSHGRNKSSQFMSSPTGTAMKAKTQNVIAVEPNSHRRHSEDKMEGSSMLMMIDAVEEDDKESVNQLFQSIEDNQFQFFNPPTFKDNYEEENLDVNDRQLLSKKEMKPQSLMSLHQRNSSGSSQNYQDDYNQLRVDGSTRNDFQQEVKTTASSMAIKSLQSSVAVGVQQSKNYKAQEQENQKREQKHPNSFTNNKGKAKVKALNLDGLNAINEQYSVPPTDERSPALSNRTIESQIQERKQVSKYLLNENQPLFEKIHSKCYVGSTNNTLVFIKQLDKTQLSPSTQSLLLREYKQAISNNQKDELIEASGTGNGNGIGNSNGGSGNYTDRLQNVTNANTVQVIDYFTTKSTIYIVSEYLPRQSLQECLLQEPKQKMNQTKASLYLSKTLSAIDAQLNYLKAEDLDNLKLSNLFLDKTTQKIKITDFLPSYSIAKSEIKKSLGKPQQNTTRLDSKVVKAIGMIYLQLLCGESSIDVDEVCSDFKVLQSYLNNENIPRHITEFLLKCIFIETATLTDVRHFLSKYQHRLKKSEQTPIGGGGGGASSNTLSISNLNRNDSIAVGRQITLSPKTAARNSKKKITVVPKDGTLVFDDKQSQGGLMGSFFDNNVADHKKGKVKVNMYLKKYGYTQSQQSFDLKITHTKFTTYFVNEERIQNETDSETTHSIPIFRQSLDEIMQARRKTGTGNNLNTNQNGITQMNYNPKYQWQFLQEIDNLPYILCEDDPLRFSPQDSYLHQSYQHLLIHGSCLMRCFDKKSNKSYFVKSVQVSDDQLFLEALKEIAIYKYIDHNIQVGLDISDREVNTDSSPSKNENKPMQIKSVFEVGRSLEESQGEDIISTNMQEHQKGNQEGGETNSALGKGYLEELYMKADLEVQRQFEGGIHTFFDAYIIQRAEMDFCFVMVFEDAEFTLKDYILKNAIDLEDNPDLEEIEEEQFLAMIKVVTKQIKRLKRIGIYHNNITPENILFQNCKSSRKRILVSNFEAALLRKPNMTDDQFSSIFYKQAQHLYKYKAPEIRKMMEICLQEKESVIYDPVKADIFSLGICGLELKLREILEDSEVIFEIEQLNQDTISGDLLMGMTDLSSSARFSTKGVLDYIKESTLQKSTISISGSAVIHAPTSIGTNNILANQKIGKGELEKKNSGTPIHLKDQQHQPYKKQLPSIQLLQKEQPVFKAVVAKGEQTNVNKQDLFQYKEKRLLSISEIDGDLQQLYQSRCARKLFLFSQAFQILESLESKYLRNKSRAADHIKFEFLLLRELGSFYSDVFDVIKSTDYFNRALAAQAKSFPDDLLAAAYLQICLATLLLFEETRNSNQLIVYLRSSLENFKVKVGNSSPKLVKVISMLGDEYALKGSYFEALHLYQECMIITNSFGYQGPQGIKLLDKLGWAFFQTSDYQSSLKFFTKSSQVKEKLLQTKDLALAETYNNLAECYRVLSVPSKAIYYYESSLNIIFELANQSEKPAGPSNILSSSVAQSTHTNSHFQSSVPNNNTLNQFQNTPRSGNIPVNLRQQLKAQVYNNLGIIYKTLQQYEKAVKLFNEAIVIRSQLFGSNSTETTECTYNLAVMFDDQGKHTEAMSLYDQVIQQFKISKELDNSIYADCIQNKAISHFHINDYAKALSLLNEAMSIKRKKANNSVSLAITLQNLALVYHKQGQYKKALQFYDEALKIFVKKLKPDHPYITTIQENMKQTQRFAK